MVSLRIELQDAHGALLSAPSEVNYLHGGYGGLLEALERALEGKAAGESLRLQLEPEDAYGEYDAKFDIETPDGPVRLRVPPGTQSGQRFRLRDRGAPSRTGGRGDLVVEVRLKLPKILDERSKELLREFGRINGESVRESTSAKTTADKQ